jgi:hypothetical protein
VYLNFFLFFFCPCWLLFHRPRPPPSPHHLSPCFSSLSIPFLPSSFISLVLGHSSDYRCGSSFVVIGCWASRGGVVVVVVVVVGCGWMWWVDVVDGCCCRGIQLFGLFGWRGLCRALTVLTVAQKTVHMF